MMRFVKLLKNLIIKPLFDVIQLPASGFNKIHKVPETDS